MRTGDLRRAAAMATLILGLAGVAAVPADAAPGPAVGETVPAFETADHTGASRDFASLSGERGLLLLFFRSADW